MSDLARPLVVGPFRIVMGVGMAAIRRSTSRGSEVDRTRGLLRARGMSDRSFPVPRWLAESVLLVGATAPSS